MQLGDPLPELVADELKRNFKRKFLKFFMILPTPKDDILDQLPFFFTQAIGLALREKFV